MKEIKAWAVCGTKGNDELWREGHYHFQLYSTKNSAKGVADEINDLADYRQIGDFDPISTVMPVRIVPIKNKRV